MAERKVTGSYFELQHNRVLRVLFLLIFAAVILGLGFIFRYFLWPFLFAVLLYMALRPVYENINTRVERPALSSGIMIGLLFTLVLTPVVLLIILIINQVFQLYQIIQREIDGGIIERLYNHDLVQSTLTFLHIKEADLVAKATDIIQSVSGSALNSATAVLAYPLNFAVNFLFMLLMLYFLFKDGQWLGSLFYRVLPFPNDIEQDVVGRLNEVVRVLITGNLVIMVLQGFIVAIGLTIAGIRVAILGGSLAAILSLIPVIGTTLVWVPAVIYLVVTGSPIMAIFLGCWCMGWYLVLENIVKPRVLGRRLHFHPVLLFFLLLGSIQAFSLPGVIIGPLLLTLFYSLWEIYKIVTAYRHDDRDRPSENGSES